MTCQICCADMAVLSDPNIRIAQCPCCGATEFAPGSRIDYTAQLRDVTPQKKDKDDE